MNDTLEIHLRVHSSGDKAVDLLHKETALPKQRIKHAMNCGAVWLTRDFGTARLRRATRKLLPGDEIHLYYNPILLGETPEAPELIADEHAFSVWSKPAGLRSQGSKWGDHCTIVRWAEKHLTPTRNGFTVHRLDRAASGLMVVAHTKRTAAHLANQFAERVVEKRYHATVHGDCSKIALPLRIDSPLDDKPALSEVTAVEFVDGSSTLDIQIETGRKHQIRRHLAEIGHPIIGDRLYGGAGPGDPDLQLRSVYLAFDHPVSGERLEYAL
ncbi:MAG: RluA family pseudouridine synthase [Pseudomonadota bacterium]